MKETKRTSNLETNLSALERWANYSVSVLAYNGAGDGAVGPPVYCSTTEDGEPVCNGAVGPRVYCSTTEDDETV